ncbi:glycosyltransferase [Pseudomonas indica]|uniref:Glycosyltransferase involved in cell wall bisynthesis n=1 Tax=Pseudomonas indica TaxID=137658 RepID=A0A1G9FVG1_9PSED|nr:glycosyltransferase [Pseudomonas indica]SDK92325.1 Glycosyltransferase involved in cell wall bisynthesis [Pseudomonas indica]
MKFLIYSEVTAARIADSMGLPEYSYYFVLRDFLPVLEALGSVHLIERPESEVDALYDEACAAGEPCIFLSFSPPQKTLLNLRCPTLPVFAWEFDTIPNESWLDEFNQDWRHVLRRLGQGITHSQMVVRAVRRELGAEFPIVSIPSPVWDKFAALRNASGGLPWLKPVRIQVRSGVVVDSHDPDVGPYIFGPNATARVVQAIREHESAVARSRGEALPEQPAASVRQQSRLGITRRYLGEWYLKVLRRNLPFLPNPSARKISVDLVYGNPEKRLEPKNTVEPPHPLTAGITPRMPDWEPSDCQLELSGVVFTALFNPYDGRKNWADMLTAFCAAFRDTPDATLVFKLGHREYQSAMHDMLIWMARMPRFQCRIVLLQGFLEGRDFDNLIRASAFAVNASHGEGQCLPLMEFLSCGKPAIAPRHSAMLDYIDESVAFVVDSWLDATAWSHDPRLAYRTCRHQLDWSSLVRAYQAAYQCAKQDPERYERMSAQSIERMRQHCSQAVAIERLKGFLGQDVEHHATAV